MRAALLLLASLLLIGATPIAGRTAGGRESRAVRPIDTPAPETKNEDTKHAPLLQPVKRAVIVAGVERILDAWNSGKLEGTLDGSFYDRSRLVDAIDRSVPRDAAIRLLAVEGFETTGQKLLPGGAGDDSVGVRSTVSVSVRTQVEFDDPDTGFQRIEGVNELVLRVTERVPWEEIGNAGGDHARSPGAGDGEENAAAAAGGAIVAPAAPASSPTWEIRGENRFSGSQYGVGGDETSAAYRRDGGQVYDEIHLDLSRRTSPYRVIRLETHGAINSSDYRSRWNGLVPERIRLSGENGEAAVPYRFEAGDFYAVFTPRTLRRSLKGASLELQRRGANETRHSLVLLGGSNGRTWRKLRFADDVFAGASYVLETERRGAWSFNVARNSWDAAAPGAVNGDDGSQTTASVTGAGKIAVGPHTIDFDAEAALIGGDRATLSDSSEGGDGAFFAALRGSGALPFRYSLRFEKYGNAYAPRGGNVTAGRSSQSVRANRPWRRAAATARFEHFRDRSGSSDPLDDYVTGLSMTFRPDRCRWRKGTFSLGGYVQSRNDRAKMIDSRTVNIRAGGSGKVTARTRMGAGLFVQDSDDRRTGTGVTVTQFDVNAVRKTTIASFTGIVAPAIRFRWTDGDSLSGFDIRPALRIDLSRGRHAVGVRLDYLRLGGDDRAAGSVETFDAGGEYTYRSSAGDLRTSFTRIRRTPEEGSATTSYRVLTLWTLPFRFIR